MRKPVLLAIVVLAVSVSSAFAQDSKGEISAGYRFTRETGSNESDPTNFPKGWYANVARDLAKAFALVGEVDGAYKSREISSSGGSLTFSSSADLKLHSFLGGLRVKGNGQHLVPFAQLLVGGMNSRIAIENRTTSGGTTTTTKEADHRTDFALAVDAGVNVVMKGTVGLQLSTGYKRVFGDLDANFLRVTAGVVIPF